MNLFFYELFDTLCLDILLIMGLILCLHYEKHIQSSKKIIIYICTAITIVMLISINATTVYFTYTYPTFGRRVSASLCYIARPFLLYLLRMLFAGNKKRRWLIALPIINGIVFTLGIWFPITFTYNENNQFCRESLGYTSHIIAFILFVFFVIDTVPEIRRRKLSDRVLFSVCILPIVITTVIDTVFTTTKTGLLIHAIVFSTFFYYFYLHLEYERAHEEDLLAKHQSQIMLSQIQPHFLYNTLTSIQALCRINPELASKTTGDFATYLRHNMENINQILPIPFTKELEHTKIYASIEKLRFPNIDIQFDIENDDFSVPSLSVQPLIENAIRHGVRIRENGIITIHSFKADNRHIITIKDNGIGFDVEKILKKDDGLPTDHIGILNVKKRIELSLSGTLTIESIIDQGTTITITIPEE